MSEMIDTAAAVRLLQGMEDVAILCHKSPDGDTLGCGFALLYALQKLGKRVVAPVQGPAARPVCLPGRRNAHRTTLCPKGGGGSRYRIGCPAGRTFALYAEPGGPVHRPPSVPNTGYAKRLLLRPTAAAACELMTDLLTELSGLDERMADCLYTGLVTDTGCFKHPSVTVDTHRLHSSCCWQAHRCRRFTGCTTA